MTPAMTLPACARACRLRCRVLCWMITARGANPCLRPHSVLALIGAVMAAMITLAAYAALAANAQIIRVLRLVGARDDYIARAFVRRFTLRAGLVAAVGTGLALLVLQSMPVADVVSGTITHFGFIGLDWIWPPAIPVLSAIVAFAATRMAASRRLKDQT